MAQWPPLMRGHPFWEATFTQHLGWLLVRGFTVVQNEKNGQKNPNNSHNYHDENHDEIEFYQGSSKLNSTPE